MATAAPRAPKDDMRSFAAIAARPRGLPAGRRRAGGRRGHDDAAQRRRLPRLRRRDDAHRLLRHPYGDWPRVVDRLDELGVRHLRDGAYGNPGAEWRDWNERYYRAVEHAADRGMRFLFGMGRPGNRTGTLDQLLAVVGGRLRHAAEALEAPNEFDHFVAARAGRPPCATTPSGCTAEPRRTRRCAGCPCWARRWAPGRGLAGPATTARGWTAATSTRTRAGARRARSTCARSLRARQRRLGRQARVGDGGRLPQRAATRRATSRRRRRRAAAVYLVRTFLEHFKKRHRAHVRVRAPGQVARARPARPGAALRPPAPRLLAQARVHGAEEPARDVGPGRRPARCARCACRVSAPAGEVRRLVLQRATARYVVALWRQASVWDRKRRRAVRVAPRTVRRTPPRRDDASRSPIPVAGRRGRPVALRRGRALIDARRAPLLLEVTPGALRDRAFAIVPRVPRYFLDLPGASAPVAWDPHAGPRPERADTRYFGASFTHMERALVDPDLDVYLTWDVRAPAELRRPRRRRRARRRGRSHPALPATACGPSSSATARGPRPAGSPILPRSGLHWLRWLPGRRRRSRGRDRRPRRPPAAARAACCRFRWGRTTRSTCPSRRCAAARPTCSSRAAWSTRGRALHRLASPRVRARREMLDAARRLGRRQPDLRIDVRVTSGFEASGPRRRWSTRRR